MVEFIKYVFLGLVQGITELLPVSSSGHVTFYSHVMGINPNQLTHFLIITNFGSFIAMFIHYRKDVLELTKSFFCFVLVIPNGRKNNKKTIWRISLN